MYISYRFKRVLYSYIICIHNYVLKYITTYINTNVHNHVSPCIWHYCNVSARALSLSHTHTN